MSMLYRQCNLSRQTAFLPIVANSILQQQHPGGTFSRRPPSSQPQHSPGNSGQQHSVGQLPKLPRLAANRLAFTENRSTFVLTLFIFKAPNYVLARTLTE